MWHIDNQCPQCGADTSLEETQRLFTCPFCRVKLYITVDDFFRYFLTPSACSVEDAVFIPYWRLKGMLFTYDGAAVRAKLIDVSHNATKLDFMPSSLGLRSQTLRLRFVSPETKGTFLEPARSHSEIISMQEEFTDEQSPPPLPEAAFIGESVSMIYSPVFTRNRVARDGILGEEIATLQEGTEKALTESGGEATGTMHFIPSLCPDCGWDMDGDPESVALTCGNCGSVWAASSNEFEKVPCYFLPGGDDGLWYLPFWKMAAEVGGIRLVSRADAVRFFNLPKAVRNEWEEIPFPWLAPAFKIHPELYMRVAERMTFISSMPDLKNDLPGKSFIYPITLPLKDAFETLRMILARSAASRRDMTSLFPSVSFTLKTAGLVYWPFHLSGTELIRPDRQLSIQVNALKWGKKI